MRQGLLAGMLGKKLIRSCRVEDKDMGLLSDVATALVSLLCPSKISVAPIAF